MRYRPLAYLSALLVSISVFLGGCAEARIKAEFYRPGLPSSAHGDPDVLTDDEIKFLIKMKDPRAHAILRKMDRKSARYRHLRAFARRIWGDWPE